MVKKVFSLTGHGGCQEVGRSAFVLDFGEKFLLDFGIKLSMDSLEYPLEITEDIKNFDSEIKTEEKIEVKENLDINKLMNGYFDKNKIKVLGSHVVRKNSEINYEVEISSDIGILKYLAKFKNKKIINDKDLSVALSDGLNLGLPVIIYSNGVLNKKGREFLSKKSTYLIFKTIQ